MWRLQSRDPMSPRASFDIRWLVLLQALLKQEVLNLDAVEDLLGKRPYSSTTLQNIDRYRWAGCN